MFQTSHPDRENRFRGVTGNAKVKETTRGCESGNLKDNSRYSKDKERSSAGQVTHYFLGTGDFRCSMLMARRINGSPCSGSVIPAVGVLCPIILGGKANQTLLWIGGLRGLSQFSILPRWKQMSKE